MHGLEAMSEVATAGFAESQDSAGQEVSDSSSSERHSSGEVPMKFGGGFAHKMRRVDWRWAAAKGFLNKDTNEWNEAMGGQEAYLKQRNDRMMARMKKSRDAKEVRLRKEDHRQDGPNVSKSSSMGVHIQPSKKSSDRSMKKVNPTKTTRKEQSTENSTRADQPANCGYFPYQAQELYNNLILTATAQNLQAFGGHLMNNQSTNSMRIAGMPGPAAPELPAPLFGVNALNMGLPSRVPSICRLDSSASCFPSQAPAEQLPSIFQPNSAYDFGRLSSIASLKQGLFGAPVPTGGFQGLQSLSLDAFNTQSPPSALPSLLPLSGLGQQLRASAALGDMGSLSEAMLRSQSTASMGGLDVFARPQSWVPSCFSRVVSQSAA